MSLAQGVVKVSGQATPIGSYAAGVNQLRIRNLGPCPVWLGARDVAARQGQLLPAGSELTADIESDVLYAVVEVATRRTTGSLLAATTQVGAQVAFIVQDPSQL